jgi:hypothetical protein
VSLTFTSSPINESEFGIANLLRIGMKPRRRLTTLWTRTVLRVSSLSGQSKNVVCFVSLLAV